MLSWTGNEISTSEIHAKGVKPIRPIPRNALIKNSQTRLAEWTKHANKI